MIIYEAAAAALKAYNRFWLLAFSLHFVVNFLTAVISGFGAPIWFVETILLVMVVSASLYAFKQYKADAAPPQFL